MFTIVIAKSESSIFLGDEYISAAYSICAGLTTFKRSILSCSAISKLRVFGTAWYGAEFAGAVSGLNKFMPGFAIVMRSGRPFTLVRIARSCRKKVFCMPGTEQGSRLYLFSLL